MHKFVKRLERICRNPYVEIVLGVVIMATGIVEGGDTLIADVTTGDLGAHHGVIVMGFIHAFKALPEILGGVAIVAHGEEREHH